MQNRKWSKACEKYPSIQAFCADAGHRGTFIAGVQQQLQRRVDIPEKIKPLEWEKLPWRWIVERTFGWLNTARRLAKELEVSVLIEEAMIRIAFAALLLRRLWRRLLKVYNFEVEDFHTYFVGTGCILVHNMCAKVSNHGNSLDTTKPANGYILKEKGTNRILKYGETTRGVKRYTQKFYKANNAYMDMVKSGTKREMHAWQHKMIEGYTYIMGERLPLNKSFYWLEAISWVSFFFQQSRSLPRLKW